ncbi:phosphatase PAP2 family protein [Candidatus Palauibacter sp.]|uniref:phosphatase PAP2 family protein n=1 Tax=Candidatus Palauibacter sp. TaxID=3101350 RepID=UPI003B5AA146
MSGRRKPLAIDRLAIGYFGVTGLVALLFGGLPGAGITTAHALIIFGIIRLASSDPRAGLRGVIRASYAVLLTPALYAELAVLNRFVTQRYFDTTVQGWDAAMFGGQPSMELSTLLPWLPFSEVLHLGYFAYYAIVPAALIGVYRTRGFDALHRTACAVTGAFFVSYLIFTFFPVAGPRYEFVRIGGEIGDGTLYRLVHGILETGSSKGTAFPSSHIAASLAAVVAAGREDARWFWLLIVPEIALTIGTVYGRFHYAADALVGALLALAVCLAVYGPGSGLAVRATHGPSHGIRTDDLGDDPREG